MKISPKTRNILLAYHRTGYKLEAVEASIEADIQRIDRIVRGALPKRGGGKKRVLDIGCGIGLATLGVHRYFGNGAEYVLLDRDCVEDKPKGFFHKRADSFGASEGLEQAVEFLTDNGVQDVSCVDIATEPFPAGKFNVIISTLSCGFHYPVSTYSAAMAAAIRDNGIIVLDVRKEHMQDAISAMGVPDIIHDDGVKHNTCVWKRLPFGA